MWYPRRVVRTNSLPVRAARLAAPCLGGLLLVACTNFHEVEKGRFYRSGQPTQEQMTRWIWRYDIQTVVRLRHGDSDDEEFRASHDPTVEAGIDFVAIPLSASRFPSRESLVQLCDVMDEAMYPILVHCMAGADRTSLVSAIYVLHQTGDMGLAREQLSFVPYLHLGWFGMDKADLVIDMYEPWHPKMSFCDWAHTIYEKPENGELPEGFFERERERAANWTPPPKTDPGS